MRHALSAPRCPDPREGLLLVFSLAMLAGAISFLPPL